MTKRVATILKALIHTLIIVSLVGGNTMMAYAQSTGTECMLPDGSMGGVLTSTGCVKKTSVSSSAAAGALSVFKPGTTIGSGTTNTFNGVSFTSVGGALAGCANLGKPISAGIKSLFSKKSNYTSIADIAKDRPGSAPGSQSTISTPGTTTGTTTPPSTLSGEIPSWARGQGSSTGALGTIPTPYTNPELGTNFNKEAAISNSAIPVTDPSAQKILEATKQNSDQQLLTEQCLNGAAYAAAKFSLQLLSNQMLNFVNTGFNGGPFYPQDMSLYLKNVANTEITKYLANGTTNDPIFGNTIRSYLIQTATNKTDGFIDQKLTTPQAIAYNNFMGDFKQGGWAALLNPRNNPIGALLNATDQVSNNINSAQQAKRDEVQRNSGFFDMKTCVKWADETYTGTNDVNRLPTRVCLEEKTTTPGSIIAAQTQAITTTNIRQLENADKINETLGAFFDQMLNGLFSKGVSALGSSSGGPDGQQVIFNATGTTNANNFGYQNSQTGVFSQDFDISRPQQLRAILQTQYNYLNRTLDSQSVMDRIVPTLGALDYCIPGPNPDWKNGLDANFQSLVSSISGGVNPPDSALTGITGSIGGALGGAFLGAGLTAIGVTVGASLGSVVPIVGTIIGAALGKLIGGLFGSKDRTIYSIQPVVYDKTTGESGPSSQQVYVLGIKSVPQEEFLPPLKAHYNIMVNALTSLYSTDMIRAMFRAAAKSTTPSTVTTPTGRFCARIDSSNYASCCVGQNGRNYDACTDYCSADTVTGGGRVYDYTYNYNQNTDPNANISTKPVDQQCVYNPPSAPTQSIDPAVATAQTYADGFVSEAIRETKNLPAYNMGTIELDKQYAKQRSDTLEAIAELESIRGEVNEIVTVAKKRYVQEQKANGTPVDEVCLDRAYVVDSKPIVGVPTQESPTPDPIVIQSNDSKVYFYTRL